jgi:hypothetical protein
MESICLKARRREKLEDIMTGKLGVFLARASVGLLGNNKSKPLFPLFV